MTEKLGPNIFESLFKMTYQPCYVDNKNTAHGQKNYYSTIYSAISSATYNSLIKINQGLYTEKIEIKQVRFYYNRAPNIKIQASQPTTNAIITNQQFPSIIVQLPTAQDKVSFQSLKFAHVCEHNYNMYKPPNWKQLKQNSYRGYRVGKDMNTNLLIKKGTVFMDECRLSLAAQKDSNKLIPSIVVEKEGTLVMSRCQVKGGIGTIGIVLKGGKLVVRQSNFKHGAIGILAVGDNKTQVIIKNCIFYDCLEGMVLNGPFQGAIQNNVISQSNQNGINILTGNRCNILNNEIKECKTGIRLENCCSVLMKNSINKSKQFGIEICAIKNIQCCALVKFNFLNQNEKGGMWISGYKNKSEIFNNQLNYNNKVGVRVSEHASPHLLLNTIRNTLGIGLHILCNSTGFIEKNLISGSLKTNVVIEGPGNIGNYLYNNIIQDSRGDGLFIINSEKFLITNNKIRNNHNGIVSVTSVVNIEENIIQKNKQNGVFLVQDNFIQFTQNQIISNKKAGLAIRNSSTGDIKKNIFTSNQIQILVENNNSLIDNIDLDNSFEKLDLSKQSDIRIPKNYYYCQLI